MALRELVSFDSATRSWRLVEVPRFVERAVREGLLGEGEVVEWRGQVS